MARGRTRGIGTVTKGFGLRLRKARLARRLSQKQLAEMSNSHSMQISRYERGEMLPALETVAALAAALHVTIDALLLGREEGDAPAPPVISDLRLYERFLDAEKLERQDREAIILLIDGVLAQRDIESRIEKRRRV